MWALLAAVLATALSVADTDPTQECITRSEANYVFSHPLYKDRSEQRLGHTGIRSSDQRAALTEHADFLNRRPLRKAYVSFEYPACDGARMHVVYTKPKGNEVPKKHRWALVHYTDSDFGSNRIGATRDSPSVMMQL